jgi:hypothetical protein
MYVSHLRHRANKLLLEPAVDIPTLVDDITVNESEGSLPTITHSDGIAILDKFFQDNSHSSNPVDGLPKSADKTADNHTDRHILQPNSSNVLTAAQLPSITGPNAALLSRLLIFRILIFLTPTMQTMTYQR